MLSLREYRGHADRLADFLPWAALIAPGVVLNKDGSFQRTARFRGPDLDSATPAELLATTARLNGALRRLGSGWAVFVEAVRQYAQDYPLSSFPEPVSALIDRERAAQFAEEGAHFESGYFLTLLWLPPAAEGAQAERWLYEGKATKGVDPREWRPPSRCWQPGPATGNWWRSWGASESACTLSGAANPISSPPRPRPSRAWKPACTHRPQSDGT